jgi:hypothetical protein
MEGWSKLTPRVVRASGVVFRLHDLRRTARTLLSKTGTTEEIAELCIGHVRRGLVATYNKDDAWGARVDAFARVSDHIARVVASDVKGEGVIHLPAQTARAVR